MTLNIIPFIFGMAFLVTGIRIIYSNNKAKKRCTEPVLAVVVNYDVRERPGGRSYAPVFEFCFNEINYIASTTYSENPKPLKLGMEVEIYTDPDDPGFIFVPQLKGERIVGVVFITIGSLVLIWLLVLRFLLYYLVCEI